jgi:hypothetical protein
VQKTISFYGICPARSRVTLVSKRIAYAYQLQRIAATFPAGCLNLLQLSFFAAGDNDAPTAAPPADFSLLAENGQVAYLVGDDTTKDCTHHVDCPDQGSYLKVHAYNSDWYDHAVDCHMTLETR